MLGLADKLKHHHIFDCRPPELFILCASECDDFIHFYCRRPPVGKQTLSSAEPPYLSSFSSVLILDKAHNLFFFSSASLKSSPSRWNTLCQIRDLCRE